MRALSALCLCLFLAVAGAAAQTDFSLERAARTLRDLSVGIGPRPMGSPAERRALEYARDAFAAAGCDTAYVLPMTTTSRANTTSGIAVGIRRGATNRIIVIGGHIDSAGPEIPGADDDGSGSAVVMEIARVHAQKKRASTIVYCCFGGEEEGLEGSRYFVEQFAELDSVALMLQVDMANGLGTIDIDPDTHGANAPQWLVRAAVEEFSALGYQGLRYPTHFFSQNYAMEQGSGSDHESFLAKGIPAVDFSTDVSKPIHTPQDNFDNFDPRGLKRSGDLVLRLAERFDGGVPERATERYWLLLAGGVPFFVPIWGVWLFTLAAIAVGSYALVRLRVGRMRKGDPGYAGWSSPKVWILGALIVCAGWLSPDLIGVLRGIRHPWMKDVGLYTVLGWIGALLSAWVVARCFRWRVTPCPYPLFRTAAIVLIPMTLLLGVVSPKLMVEPASCLLLSSLAMLIRQRYVRVVLVLVSPVWLLRLFFSEWSTMLFRITAIALPGTWSASALADLGSVLLLSTLMFPFFLTAVALYRESESVRRMAGALQSPVMFGAAALAFASLGGYLMTLPAYDRYWSRDVRINQRYALESGERTIEVKSSEYLTGMTVSRGGKDSLIEGRMTRLELAPLRFDTSWVRVARSIDSVSDSGATRYSARILLACARRPYTVTLRYASGSGRMSPVESPWFSAPSRGEQVLQWRAFPDSVIEIPVRFAAAKGDSVVESLEVTFDRLADPLEVAHETAYVIPRTTYVSKRVYR